MKPLAFLMTALVAVHGSGCLLQAGLPGADPDENVPGEDVITAESALEGANSLSLNSLSLNSLSLNALSLNALSLNALVPNVLTSLQDPGSTGDLARQLVRYAATCALDSTQSFDYSWVDILSITHNEHITGALGLATGWSTTGLSASERLWVSSCLIARVNWYGVAVMISLRGAHSELSDISTEEASAYTIKEGAFWGDLFGETPTAFACYDALNVTASRARLRDCAAGHVNVLLGIDECGIIQITGPCSQRCGSLDVEGNYYPSCAAVGQTPTASTAITTWLHY